MPLPPGVPEIVIALLGLCVGSFLNVCIHRLPERRSVATPGSSCPRCGYVLRWYDNIPVLSYAILRGKCRSCAQPISLWYPAIELITAGVFLLHWYAFGWSVVLPVRLVLGSALIVLFMIDLEHQILPDVITLPGIVAGFGASLFLPPGPWMSLLGVLLGGGLLWAIAEVWLRVRKIEGMGFGDVKMLAMVGAWLGAKAVVLTFVLSSMMGGLVGVVLIAARRADMATRVPFGTMLAVAALVASLYGDAILGWYLSRF